MEGMMNTLFLVALVAVIYEGLTGGIR